MRHKHAIQDTQQPQSRKELNNTLRLKDNRETHLENIPGSMILPDISILARTSNKIDLIILQALLIKEHKPIINIQTDDFNTTLNIF